MKVKSTSLVVAVMVLGLLTVGVVSLAVGRGGRFDGPRGFLSETMNQILAEKLDVETDEPESLMGAAHQVALEEGTRVTVFLPK
ncbi:MAG: hypothetical protein ACOCZX_03170 [Candidatus Bipolaricaulota bacterium]